MKNNKFVLGLGTLFRKGPERSKAKKSAVAIVDYENWYSCLANRYGLRPDLKIWVEEIRGKYDVKEIVAFVDLSKPSYQNEYDVLEKYTTSVIDTRKTGKEATSTKDYTDFAIVDFLYQRELRKKRNTDAVILFSGDGHFCGVLDFLKKECGKEIVVYGISRCVNRRLANIATECIELSPDITREAIAVFDILRYMRYMEENSPGYVFFFNPTLASVSRRFGWEDEMDTLSAALHTLIQNQYILRPFVDVPINGEIQTRKAMRVDWDRVRADGLDETGVIPYAQRNRCSSIKPELTAASAPKGKNLATAG